MYIIVPGHQQLAPPSHALYQTLTMRTINTDTLITVLHGEGGVYRDPQKWLRNLWMTPNGDEKIQLRWGWCHLTIWSIIWLLSGAVINHSHRAFCFYIPVGLCATSGPELEKKKPERSTISLSTQDGTGAYCISISSISSFWQIGKEVVLGIAGASLLWLEDATLVMGYLVILAPTVEIPAIRVWLICLSCDYKRRWLRLWSSLWQVQEAQWYLSWAWHRLVENGEKGNELVNVKILVLIITSSLRPSY